MKKEFEKPALIIINFVDTDVIVTSVGGDSRIDGSNDESEINY